jgi:N,N'-diacetylchitobiose transport system permease protein
MRPRLAGRVLYEILGALVFCVMVFPVYWMVTTALKPGNDILRYHPKLVPHPATLANFTDAIHRPYFWDDVRNSLIVTCVVIVASVTIAFFAALALARFRFHGKKAAIVIVIVVQMVPLNALIIPLYVLLSRAHQVDKLSGLIVTYLTFVLPFSVWTLRGFLLGIPKDLEEAAMVDGSTRLGVFLKILLPLMGPGLVATSVFAFITTWNEYIFARVLLNDQSKQTVTVWLSYFYGTSRHTDWGALMAASTLTSIPVVVFFLLVQRKIAFGLTAGAVRG